MTDVARFSYDQKVSALSWASDKFVASILLPQYLVPLSKFC